MTRTRFLLLALFGHAALFGVMIPPADGRTVITVGTEPLVGFTTQNITTNGQGTATITVNTLASPVTLGTLTFRNYSGMLQQTANGADWTELGGGAAASALKTTAHTGIMASAADVSYDPAFDGNLQISARIRRNDTSNAESLLALYSTTYGCHVWNIGIDATDHPYFMYVTGISGSAGNYTCTTATITSTQTVSNSAWKEVALRRESDSIVFYVNGVPETAQVGATPLTFSENVTARIGEGLSGLMASLKVASTLTWNATAARPIDLNGDMTPGAIWLFNFAEKRGATTTDRATNTVFTLNDATWEQLTVSPLY